MNIYIKSFNRPYLLHRTLLSIKYFLIEFDGKIIVLDDGTPDIYLSKLKEKFSDIIIVKSPFYEKKSQAIVEGKIPEKKIPANFWREIISKGTEEFILLEDDMWFCEPINFTDFQKEIQTNKMDMIRFFWLSNGKLISNNIEKKEHHFSVVEPKLFTNNAYLFNLIYRKNTLKIKNILNRFYDVENTFLKYYQYYIVAGGFFSKKYYLACWADNQEDVDEMLQIYQLLKNRGKINVGNMNKEVLKTTLKTTASTVGKTNLLPEINVFDLNKVLNEEWLKGNSYQIDDFHNDLSSEWIKTCIENNSFATGVTYEQWEQWYKNFKKSYENIGCKI